MSLIYSTVQYSRLPYRVMYNDERSQPGAAGKSKGGRLNRLCLQSKEGHLFLALLVPFTTLARTTQRPHGTDSAPLRNRLPFNDGAPF